MPSNDFDPNNPLHQKFKKMKGKSGEDKDFLKQAGLWKDDPNAGSGNDGKGADERGTPKVPSVAKRAGGKKTPSSHPRNDSDTDINPLGLHQMLEGIKRDPEDAADVAIKRGYKKGQSPKDIEKRADAAAKGAAKGARNAAAIKLAGMPSHGQKPINKRVRKMARQVTRDALKNGGV